jgi:hypothetical protein
VAITMPPEHIIILNLIALTIFPRFSHLDSSLLGHVFKAAGVS